MKLKSVFGLSILGLATTTSSTTVVHADPLCDPLEQCRAMRVQVDARIQELVENGIPKLTEILKIGVSQSEAETFCRDKGMRLPTARELALVSHSLGAQGLSETAKFRSYLVKGADSAGNPNHFFFSNKGYQRPADDLGNYFYWSSSVHPHDSNFFYALSGYYGSVRPRPSQPVVRESAVRCVR